MFAKERRKLIADKLYKESSIKVSELMELFDVSIETIRRDLEYLEKQGVLQRVHGGALLVDKDYRRELQYTARDLKHTNAKKELAEKAVSLVKDGQSIALDVSTTNTQFAKALKNRVERLTVLTNSLSIVNELVDMPNYTIIFIGGVIRNEERCTVGEFAEMFASQFHVDLFFMSISGISLEEGLTDFGIGEVQIKKKILQTAKETIVIADSSKFDQVSLLKVCPMGQISTIVTDSRLNKEQLDRYKGHGINIL